METEMMQAEGAKEWVDTKRGEIKQKIVDFKNLVTDKSRRTVDRTETLIHENPWKAIGVSAGIGLLLGFAMSFFSRSERYQES